MPNISIIIPALNEAAYITECIKSLLDGGYPSNKIELLVIDGGSTDGTCQIVTNLKSIYPQIKLLHNAKKIVPVAMNIGAASALHDIIVWVGAHATYHHDYLTNSVNILLEENCASVGGVITPKGKTFFGQAIAVATSNKFGIGNAKYRYAKYRQSVDTVFGGCWKKESIIKAGGFNENWTRNQDYEFNYRLRKKIGPIILDPSIRCQYYCRESITGLAKQYFNYGFWRFKTSIEHPSSFSPRQAAPLLLLFGLTLSLGLSLFGSVLSLIIPFIYAALSLSISFKLSLEHSKISYIYLLPVIFVTLHLSWALGFSKNAILSKLGRRSNN